MLCHVYDLRHEISVFMKKKRAELLAFAVPLWMCDFACIVYTTEHLNQLNAQLQGREQPVNELFQFVSAFETKTFVELLRREFADRFTDHWLTTGSGKFREIQAVNAANRRTLG